MIIALHCAHLLAGGANNNNSGGGGGGSGSGSANKRRHCGLIGGQSSGRLISDCGAVIATLASRGHKALAGTNLGGATSGRSRLSLNGPAATGSACAPPLALAGGFPESALQAARCLWMAGSRVGMRPACARRAATTSERNKLKPQLAAQRRQLEARLALPLPPAQTPTLAPPSPFASIGEPNQLVALGLQLGQDHYLAAGRQPEFAAAEESPTRLLAGHDTCEPNCCLRRQPSLAGARLRPASGSRNNYHWPPIGFGSTTCVARAGPRVAPPVVGRGSASGWPRWPMARPASRRRRHTQAGRLACPSSWLAIGFVLGAWRSELGARRSALAPRGRRSHCKLAGRDGAICIIIAPVDPPAMVMSFNSIEWAAISPRGQAGQRSPTRAQLSSAHLTCPRPVEAKWTATRIWNGV